MAHGTLAARRGAIFSSLRLVHAIACLVALPLLPLGACSGDEDGTAANTCPPTLVNYGSSPGIICQEQTGDTCADTEQFCECGDQTIEGRPWVCVPTASGCPGDLPVPGSACGVPSRDCGYVRNGVRSSCRCTEGSWTCSTNDCGLLLPSSDASCATGATCDYFIEASRKRPNSARNISCSCGADQLWTCEI